MRTKTMIDGEHVDADRQADGVLVAQCPRCDGRVLRVRVGDRTVLVDDAEVDDGSGTGPFVALDAQGQARISRDGTDRQGGESMHDPHAQTCPFRVVG